MRVLCLLLSCALLSGVVRADPPQSDAIEFGQAPYRRVYVPADRPELWPSDDQVLIPTQRDEVLRLLQNFHKKPYDTLPSVVTEAQCWATLRPEGLEGQGRLTVTGVGDREVFVPWGGTGLRIMDARWESDGQPVLLGQWGQTEQSQHGMLVNRDGELLFRFLATAEQDSGDLYSFLFETPQPLLSSLLVDLPDGFTPRMDRGVVQRLQDPSPSPLAAELLPREWARWLLRPTSGSAWRVIIDRPSNTTRTRDQLPSYSQDSLCTVSEFGVSTECHFTIVAHQTIPPVVQVRLSEQSRVLQVEQDGLPLEWGMLRDSAGRPLLRAMPRSSDLDSTTLTVTTINPPHESGVESITQPSLANADWQEGRLTLHIEQPLSLLDITDTQHLTLTQAPADPSEAVDQVYKFHASNARPRLTAHVGHTPREVPIEITREVSLGPNRATCDVILRFLADESRLPEEINLVLQKGWKVRAVTSTPPNTLADWTEIRDDPALAASLALTFKRQSTVKPTTVRVSLSRAWGGGLTSTPLVRMAGVVSGPFQVLRDELVVSPAPPYQLVLKKSPPLTSSLTMGIEGDSFRFDSDTQNVTDAIGDAAVALVSEPQTGNSDCRVTVSRAADTWTYEADFNLPTASLDSYTTLRFAPPLPNHARVILGSGPARLASEFSNEAPADDNGVSQLVLPLHNMPNGVCSIEFDSTQATSFETPLPSWDLALSRSCLLRIKGRGLRMASEGLTPVLNQEPNAATPSSKWFRFDSSRVGTEDLRVTVNQHDSGQAEIAATLRKIETRLLNDGLVRHSALIAVHPEQETVQLRLPGDSKFLSARDAAGHALQVQAGVQGQLTISLPARNGSNEQIIVFDDPNVSWSAGSTLSPKPPEGVRLAAWHWTVVAPEPYSLRGAAIGAEQLDWRERLFGPLGYSDATSPVNPFSYDSWRDAAKRAWRLSGLGQGPPDVSPTEEEAPYGWRSHELLVVGQGAASVQVYDRQRRLGAAAALAGLIMLAGVLVWPIAPRTVAAATLLAGAAALLLPAVVALWGIAAWLGLLVSGVLHWLKSTWSARRTQNPAPKSGALSTVSLIVLLSFVSNAGAQAPAQPRIEPILIPIDEAGQPSGDKWYLTDGFLRKLSEAGESSHTQSPADWVLQSQQISGAFQEQATRKGFAPGNWSLQLKLWTLRREVAVSLPIIQADAEWAAKALVDGISVPVRWSSDPPGCVLLIPEPGEHQVVIEFSPYLIAGEDGPCVDVRIPNCPRSKLSLITPPGINELTSLTSRLSSEAVKEGTRYLADLGGAGKVSVCWSIEQSPQELSRPSCDLLQWASLTRNSARVTCRYLVEGTPPLPRTLHAEIPAGWSVTPDLGAAGVEVSPDEPWSNQASRLTYTASFLLNRSSVLGAVSISATQPREALLRSRTLAYTNSPALTVTQSSSAGTTAVPAAKFLASWGSDAGGTPREAFSLSGDLDRDWRLKVQATQSVPEISDHSLLLLVGRRAISCNYQAVIEPGMWPMGHMHLRTEEGFKFQSVSAFQGGAPIAVRAVQLKPGRLSVFLASPAPGAGDLTLEVRGAAPALTADASPAPIVRLEAESSPALRLQVRKQPEVLVELANPALPTNVTTSDAAALPGAPVANLRIAEGAAAPLLLARPNLPAYHATTLSIHAPQKEGGLRQSAAILVQAIRGEVGQVLIRVHDPRRTPVLATNQGATLDSHSEFGPGCWRLSLRTPLVDGQQRVFLLALDTAPVSPPCQAVLLELPEASRHTSLVALAPGATSRWQWRPISLSALRDNPPPEIIRQAATQADYYLARSPAFANLDWDAGVGPTTSLALTLQDCEAIPDTSGTAVVRTRFYLRPHGAKECAVQIPDGHDVVLVDLNGNAPLALDSPPGKLRLSLLDKSTPQLLSVVTTVPASLATRGIVLPHLLDADGKTVRPAQSLLSTIHDSNKMLLAAEGVEPTSIAAHTLPLVQQTTEMASLQPEPASVWWRSRLGDTMEGAREKQATRPTGEGSPSGQETSETLALPPDAPEYVADRSTQLMQAIEPYERHCYQVDPSVPVRLQWVATGSVGWPARLGLLAVLTALAFAWSRGEQLGIPSWLAEHRRTTWAIAGLLWWAWLPLGFCGLILMAAAAAAELRDRRRLLSLTGWTG